MTQQEIYDKLVLAINNVTKEQIEKLSSSLVKDFEALQPSSIAEASVQASGVYSRYLISRTLYAISNVMAELLDYPRET